MLTEKKEFGIFLSIVDWGWSTFLFYYILLLLLLLLLLLSRFWSCFGYSDMKTPNIFVCMVSWVGQFTSAVR